jgi:hypothetical protein
LDRQKIVEEILIERSRQLQMPGIEFDIKNTPNDWSAIISSYVLRNLNHKNIKPNVDEFKEDLIAAAAVIVAAIEHIDNMKSKNLFT